MAYYARIPGPAAVSRISYRDRSSLVEIDDIKSSFFFFTYGPRFKSQFREPVDRTYDSTRLICVQVTNHQKSHALLPVRRDLQNSSVESLPFQVLLFEFDRSYSYHRRHDHKRLVWLSVTLGGMRQGIRKNCHKTKTHPRHKKTRGITVFLVETLRLGNSLLGMYLPILLCRRYGVF